MPCAEFGRRCAGVDLALEPAQNDLLDTLPLGRLELIGLAETHRIKDFEEPCEAPGMAVMRGRAQKKAVFELRGDQPQRAAQVAVVAESRWHQVVALIDDEEIPRQVR